MSEQPHPNHGHSPARWTGTVISAVGFLIGGLAFPFHIWPVVYAGGALQIVALIAVGAMNAAGYGVPDVWGELKAEAKAGKPSVDALGGNAAPVLAAAPEAAPEAAVEAVAETTVETASETVVAATATTSADASTDASGDAAPALAESEAEVEAEAQVKELSTQQS